MKTFKFGWSGVIRASLARNVRHSRHLEYMYGGRCWTTENAIALCKEALRKQECRHLHVLLGPGKPAKCLVCQEELGTVKEFYERRRK